MEWKRLQLLDMILLSSYFLQTEDGRVYWIWLSSLLMILPPSSSNWLTSFLGTSSVYNAFLCVYVLFLSYWVCRYLKIQFCIWHNSSLSSLCCKLLFSSPPPTKWSNALEEREGEGKSSSFCYLQKSLLLINIVLTFLLSQFNFMDDLTVPSILNSLEWIISANWRVFKNR